MRLQSYWGLFSIEKGTCNLNFELIKAIMKSCTFIFLFINVLGVLYDIHIFKKNNNEKGFLIQKKDKRKILGVVQYGIFPKRKNNKAGSKRVQFVGSFLKWPFGIIFSSFFILLSTYLEHFLLDFNPISSKIIF